MATKLLPLPPLARTRLPFLPKLGTSMRTAATSAFGNLLRRENDRVIKDKLDRKDEVFGRRAARWDKVKQEVSHAGVFAATSLVIGHQVGYRGPLKLLGMPLDFAIGIAGMAVGLALPERNALAKGMVTGLGHGAMGSFLHQVGRGLGRDRREAKGKAPMVSGSLGAMPLIEDTGGSALPDS